MVLAVLDLSWVLDITGLTHLAMHTCSMLHLSPILVCYALDLAIWLVQKHYSIILLLHCLYQVSSPLLVLNKPIWSVLLSQCILTNPWHYHSNLMHPRTFGKENKVCQSHWQLHWPRVCQYHC